MIAIFFGLAVIILAITTLRIFLFPQLSVKRIRNISGIYLALVGVFVSGLLLHTPLYLVQYANTPFFVLNSILSAFHHTLRMFVLDGELEPLRSFAYEYVGRLATPYFGLSEVVYVAGPLLTFGVVLSFFKNISAYCKFYGHLFSKTCIFSELNEQSLCLAKSIKENHTKTLIVFTDVYATETETSAEQRRAAAALGAICFKCDITTLRLRFHSKINAVRLFIIGSDEDENIRQAALLAHRYTNNAHMELYIFSDSMESSLLVQSLHTGEMRVQRISDSLSLINTLLYSDGAKLFETAEQTESGEKLISAVILGLGRYGTEMLKALSWFGQMEGYRLIITAIDLKEDVSERLTYRCPELMSSERNHVFEDGEAQYSIDIHAETNAFSEKCSKVLTSLPTITYCFVALGNDRLNIEAAACMREICERRHVNPVIQAVVYDSASAKLFCNATNFRGKPYNICCVGSIQERYTEHAILTPELEKEALRRHLLWGDEDSFWRYEFNYRSSIASALHHKVKLACHIPGADLPPEERNPEDRNRLRLIEHRRWNAYMRTEGYCYSGTRDKKSRNDLAKLHNDLIPFDLLTEDEKAKDDV